MRADSPRKRVQSWVKGKGLSRGKGSFKEVRMLSVHTLPCKQGATSDIQASLEEALDQGKKEDAQPSL